MIETILTQSIDGQEIENVKVDCKLKWWDLSDALAIHEFLKDTSAIANTFGLDGFLIIGFDDKNKTFVDAQFSDCNLSDTSHIRNLLIKHVDIAFDLNTFDITFNGHKLSVIHIPPSIDKPHVIRVYKRNGKNGVVEEPNKIFIRKNTSNYVASKNDIDIMYYDRKNVIPEYKLIVSVNTKSLKILYSTQAGAVTDFRIEPIIIFENQGTRPVAITSIKISFKLFEDGSENEKFFFDIMNAQPIIVPINNIINTVASLGGKSAYNYKTNNFIDANLNIRNLFVDPIILMTSNGKEISVPIMKY
jgi:hypothetical protein